MGTFFHIKPQQRFFRIYEKYKPSSLQLPHHRGPTETTKQKMALHLREDEARRLTAAKTKGAKEEEIDKMDKIPKIKKLLKDRGSELEKVIEGAKGVCMIEVGLELEMDQRDMDEALEIDDPEQLVEVFPALTKANAQRLLDILKAKKTEFEETLAGGEQAVVEMRFSGYGVHCGEGWIVADRRLLENLTQIANATVTFVVAGEGEERKEIVFEPTERLSFHVAVKPTAVRTCSATHPGLSFMKLGHQCSTEENPDQKHTEWESAEQKLLDEAKLPEFRLPLFNDLEITKKFSIVQIGSTTDGTHERTISLIDDLDIVPTTGNNPGVFFLKMKIKNVEKYLPYSPRGGVAFSQDGDLFSLCGFVFAADDGLGVAEGAVEAVPTEEFLPLHGDTLTIFTNAKNFIYNRIGQELTQGQSIMFNYQMMAEFAKDLLIKSLGPTFDIQFVFPAYEKEKFTAGHSMDVSGYFANEARKGSI